MIPKKHKFRKAKAPKVAAVGAFRKTQKRLQYTDDRATHTFAPERRIIVSLKAGPKTTDQLRALGCYQVSARIHGLRVKGWNIQTELFDDYAADGYSHRRMGRYTLIAEPEGNV